MRVISQDFIGRLIICSNCGALLEWEDKDIYGEDIYCPLCKQKTHIDYNKNYDGIIKKEEIKEKNE